MQSPFLNTSAQTLIMRYGTTIHPDLCVPGLGLSRNESTPTSPGNKAKARRLRGVVLCGRIAIELLTAESDLDYALYPACRRDRSDTLRNGESIFSVPASKRWARAHGRRYVRGSWCNCVFCRGCQGGNEEVRSRIGWSSTPRVIGKVYLVKTFNETFNDFFNNRVVLG